MAGAKTGKSDAMAAALWRCGVRVFDFDLELSLEPVFQDDCCHSVIQLFVSFALLYRTRRETNNNASVLRGKTLEKAELSGNSASSRINGVRS
jgi:hypothetical protein